MQRRVAVAAWIGVLAALLLGGPGRAYAQIVPPVRVPELPGLPTQELNRALDDVRQTADSQQLRELRRLRVRNLLRANRTVLESDPRGALIVRNEVVALSPAAATLERARAAGFTVGRTRTLEGLDVTIVVLQAPPGVSTRRALQMLRSADPAGVYDFNHIYMESGEVTPVPAPAGSRPAVDAGRPSALKVGLIDGGVQKTHAVLRGMTIHEHGCTGSIPSAHGTAVASLIVGQAQDFHGAVPGAELYAADVYCGLPTGGAVDALAEAFAWMSRERVPVINISLVGPPNGLLEQIVRIITARGHIVVAAVGNDGPGAPPLFPAAYPAVVAVTGVDAKERVLVEACRGNHVDFAAPGADMSAAALETGFALVRGTSFAAPIVAGLLAQQLAEVDRQRAGAALAALVSQATDLGVRGRDKVYGDGLVGEALRPPQGLAKL
jgi:subtilisin family serine protease